MDFPASKEYTEVSIMPEKQDAYDLEREYYLLRVMHIYLLGRLLKNPIHLSHHSIGILDEDLSADGILNAVQCEFKLIMHGYMCSLYQSDLLTWY
jgi:hypothetical protein